MIDPEVGVSTPVTSRARVDLPEPDCPTRAVTMRRRREKKTSSTASVSTWRKPCRERNTLVTPSTSRNTSPRSASADSSTDFSKAGPAKRTVRGGSPSVSGAVRCSRATWQAARGGRQVPPESSRNAVTAPSLRVVGISSSSGASLVQRAIFSGQRGAKGQPSSGWERSGGQPGT